MSVTIREVCKRGQIEVEEEVDRMTHSCLAPVISRFDLLLYVACLYLGSPVVSWKHSRGSMRIPTSTREALEWAKPKRRPGF